MKRLISMLLLCPLLLLTGGILPAQDKIVPTPYYPLPVGATWHYRSGESKFTIRVSKHEKVGDVLCARLEVTRDGKVIAWQHLAATADGVYRYDLGYRLPQPDPKGGQAVEQTVEDKPKPPILVLKLPPKKGDGWKVDSKSDGKTFRGAFRIDEQEVKVPAGAYKAVRVSSQDLEVNGLKPTITTYYAEGVGMVKQVIQEGNVTVEIELEKFDAGK